MALFLVISDPGAETLLDYVSLPTGPYVTLHKVGSIPGSNLRVPDSLREDVQGLTRSALVPAAQLRRQHFGITRKSPGHEGDGILPIEPFLVGPSLLILAGTYTRSGLSHWFIPADVPDLRPWLEAAYVRWSEEEPEQFPAKPNWVSSTEWHLPDEAQIADDLAERHDEFDRLKRDHEAAVEALEANLRDARNRADNGWRVLVTGQGDDLADVVRDALRALDFKVQDMDEVWPEGAKREDFRVTDPGGDPEWLAITEVTGTKKGVAQAKYTRLQNHVKAYLHEEKPDVAPGEWLVVNQFVEQDPSLRHEVFGPHFRGGVADGGGLIFETVALFVLLRASLQDSTLKVAIRDRLRGATGLLDRTLAEAWLDDIKGTSTAD